MAESMASFTGMGRKTRSCFSLESLGPPLSYLGLLSAQVLQARHCQEWGRIPGAVFQGFCRIEKMTGR